MRSNISFKHYHNSPTSEVYLEPSWTSTVELFGEKGFRTQLNIYGGATVKSSIPLKQLQWNGFSA